MLGLMDAISSYLASTRPFLIFARNSKKNEYHRKQIHFALALQHSTFNLEFFPLNQQLMCELASNGLFLTAPEMERDVSFQ